MVHMFIPMSTWQLEAAQYWWGFVSCWFSRSFKVLSVFSSVFVRMQLKSGYWCVAETMLRFCCMWIHLLQCKWWVLWHHLVQFYSIVFLTIWLAVRLSNTSVFVQLSPSFQSHTMSRLIEGMVSWSVQPGSPKVLTSDQGRSQSSI